MVFEIPEEKEFRLVVDGLYNELTNKSLPFSLEIDCEAFDSYSFPNNCAYFDYSVSFRVIDRMEHFIQMSYDSYDLLENAWQFSYCNIFNSEIGSSDTIYDLFVQIIWREEKNEDDQYIFVSEVIVWVEFRDHNGDCGFFL